MKILKSRLLNCFAVAVLLTLATTMNSCGDKVEEGELITTVQLTLNLPGDSGKIYTWLTIGDGLVAQIPSLLLSLATAIIVTRVTTAESISEQASVQLANPTALFISAVILMILGMVPGMPHLMFITLAAAISSALIFEIPSQ